MATVAEENWRILKELLPEGWEEGARRFGAVRRLRGFVSAEALLRVMLLHVGRGYSLRETAVQAKAAGLGEVSDVALLKRLRSAEGWLRELCLALLRETGVLWPDKSTDQRVRVVDATLVQEPGKTGSQWRLHYALQLPSLICDFFELTSTEGSGAGETFTRFPVSRGELILGDAGYCCGAGIEHVHRQGADVLVRLNPQAVRLQTAGGRRWDLLVRLAGLPEVGQVGEWTVWVAGDYRPVAGRICAIRKSEEAIRRAHRKLRRRATRNGSQLRAQTLEYTKYVLVFTTLPGGTFPAAEVLDWYRVRWQIELVFKRLKSVAQFGHLPKYDDRSSRAWLYGKFLVALLAQKLARVGREFSPWGYRLPGQAPTE